MALSHSCQNVLPERKTKSSIEYIWSQRSPSTLLSILNLNVIHREELAIEVTATFSCDKGLVYMHNRQRKKVVHTRLKSTFFVGCDQERSRLIQFTNKNATVVIPVPSVKQRFVCDFYQGALPRQQKYMTLVMKTTLRSARYRKPRRMYVTV